MIFDIKNNLKDVSYYDLYLGKLCRWLRVG